MAVLISALMFMGSGSAMRADDYEYVPDTSRNVKVVHGSLVSIGKLDAKGNFIPDKRWVNMQGPLFGIPPSLLINVPRERGSRAYEYRSGRLIEGELNNEGDFIPDVGSKVIPFEEYLRTYDPARSPRIYNLPGKIVKKGGSGKQ